MAHRLQHHKLWHSWSSGSSQPSTTSGTNLPLLLCPRLSHHRECCNHTGRRGWRISSSREGGLAGLLPGEGGSGLCSSRERRGVRLAALDLGGALLRLGTEPQWHMTNPRASLTHFPQRSGDLQGKEHQGQVLWQSYHHLLKRTQGTLPKAATYSGGCSQQWGGRSWAGEKGEPREREDTQLLLEGELLSLYMQEQAGTVQASLTKTPNAPVTPTYPSTYPRTVLLWRIHPG